MNGLGLGGRQLAWAPSVRSFLKKKLLYFFVFFGKLAVNFEFSLVQVRLGDWQGQKC